MTDEYFEQIDQIVEQRWNSDEAAAWGLIFDQAHADSRHAWEIYGVWIKPGRAGSDRQDGDGYSAVDSRK